jgi:serine/threonine protein kinase
MVGSDGLAIMKCAQTRGATGPMRTQPRSAPWILSGEDRIVSATAFFAGGSGRWQESLCRTAGVQAPQLGYTVHQDNRPILLPHSLHRPVAFTEGSFIRNLNRTGVRFETDCRSIMSRSMTLKPGTCLGPYEVQGLLGAGGMGEVYAALDPRLRRSVAVKVLPLGTTANTLAVARLQREAHAVAALNHPNICSIFDIGEHDGSPFLVMERLEGETLASKLMRGAFELPALLDIGIPLADALEAAHARGLIHRDLKPANVFLTSQGQPKVLDFGLAKTISGSEDTTRVADPQTGVGEAAGTVVYMAPEQLRGEELDRRADIFSFGLVLYEMATGRRAFDGSTTAIIAAAILNQPPPAPRAVRPELHPQLERILLKAVEKERDLRYQSAADLRADLKRLRREIQEPALQPREDAPVVAPAGSRAGTPPISSSDANSSKSRLYANDRRDVWFRL